MKRFQRSCTAWLLALAMVFSLLPAAALAASSEEEEEAAVQVTENAAAEQTEDAGEESTAEAASGQGYRLNDAATSGSCGDNVTWTLKDGVLTISGTGEMEDYSHTDTLAPWYDSNSDITGVVIQEGVTYIGTFAFQYCSALTSVTIPDSVTTIGGYAFFSCTGLTSITIPDSVTDINLYAFVFCRGLEQVVVGSGVERIGSFAFSGCTKLTSITFRGSAPSIYSNSFQNVTATVNYPNTLSWKLFGTGSSYGGELTWVSYHAGIDYNDIPTLSSGETVQVSVTTAGEYAPNLYFTPEQSGFYTFSTTSDQYTYGRILESNGNLLTYDSQGSLTAYCAAGSTYIIQWKFTDSTVTGALSITVQPADNSCGENLTWSLTDGVLTISGDGAMENYTVGSAPWYTVRGSITSVVLEDGVTSIGYCAFCRCTAMTGVTLPESLTTIGSSAFMECTSLTDVTIPDSVTSMEGRAFYNCTALTNVTIGSGLTELGKYVFNNLTSLMEIRVSGENSAFCDVDGVLFSKDMTTLLCYPAGKTDPSYTVPEGVTAIEDYGFSNCAGLVSVVIPNSVTAIGQSAFSDCTGLVNITLPDSVTAIERFTFNNCSALEAVVIPKSVTSIGDNGFYLCAALTDVYYTGTQTDWDAISISSSGNTPLDSAALHCNSAEFLLGHVALNKLSLTASGVALSWGGTAYAEGYRIYRKADSEEGYRLLATLSDASAVQYTDTAAANGVSYSYYVQAWAGEATADSDAKSITYLASTVTTGTGQTPAASSNTGDQNYTDYGLTVKSYLAETDGGLMRVEYIDGQVVVEYYDSDYTLTGTKTIECELSRFGGFYAGEDAYYLVFGQSNLSEDDCVEVIRVVKYSTDWVRLGQASLYGANTYIPFDGGSCRMTEYGGYLYIRTCHEMYASDDGLHHQANMMVVVQESSMEITGSHSIISNNATGYVSHSFNQFVLVDDAGKLVALDHGDGYPRAAILFRYISSAGSTGFGTANSNVSLLSFQGSTGDNYTGASLGGLEYSSTCYLAVGNSVTQDNDWSSHTARNVFVAVADRNDLSSDGVTVHWITDYDDDGSISASTPQLVKLDSDSFLLLWTTTESAATKLHYVYLDGEGNTVSNIYTVNGCLSDCQPILSNGCVTWYVTGSGGGSTAPCFYTIAADGTYRVDSGSNASFLFSDVTRGDAWYYSAVYWAYDLGITAGYDDGTTQTFKPNNNCTRAEFATFLYTLAQAYGLANAGDTAGGSFTDVKSGSWYYTYVMWAAENGIVSGYTDGTFRPNSQITRAEAVTMLYSFYKFFVNGGEDPAVAGKTGSSFSDLSETAWYYTYMAWAVENGVVSGYPDGTCRPNTNCTRAVMVVLLYATASNLL